MSPKIYFTIFLTLIVLGLGGFIAIRLGFFPVALVNKTLIRESYFNATSEEIISSFTLGSRLPDNEELRRMVLQKIIEDRLLYNEAEKYFDKDIVSKANAESIKTLLDDKFSDLGISLDEWLINAKKSANVHILMSGFAWSEGKVMACKSGLGERQLTEALSSPAPLSGC